MCKIIESFLNTCELNELNLFRCVPPSQKTFAMGVQYWIMRPLGAIPGPIVFGLIFDATCKLWQEAECSGEQGSCWIHDSAEVSLYVFIACKFSNLSDTFQVGVSTRVENLRCGTCSDQKH